MTQNEKECDVCGKEPCRQLDHKDTTSPVHHKRLCHGGHKPTCKVCNNTGVAQKNGTKYYKANGKPVPCPCTKDKPTCEVCGGSGKVSDIKNIESCGEDCRGECIPKVPCPCTEVEAV